MPKPQQVIVVGPSWVGDMVMAQSLFAVLRAADPAVAIDVVAPGWSKGILSRMPEVRGSYTLAAGHGELALGARRALGRELRAIAYDRAIVLPRSLKSALVPWFARVPVRTGYRGEMRYGLLTDVRTLDKRVLDQTVKRFVALGLPAAAPLPEIPRPQLTIDAASQAELARTHGLDTDGSAVALMPGAAYGPAKMWPPEYFADLAAQLTAAGRQVWIVGAENERPLGEQIAGGNARALNLCGTTSLDATVDLFAMTAGVVTNDSGLMHVAAAAGARVIAVYGSSSPDFTPPLTDRRVIHYLDLECSPCHRRECPLGHLNCLRQIEPADVLASVLQS